MAYEAVSDPYCYPGTSVLKNYPGLRSQARVDQFEAQMTALRAEETLPAGRLSARHYRAIHRHLFQDVYPWAGKYRTVRVSKDGSMFCYPEYIASQMSELFDELRSQKYLRALALADFSHKVANFLASLNAIHCFREGNGRVQLTFLALLCEQSGHALAFDRLDPADFLDAMIRSFRGDERRLARILRDVCS